MDIKQNIGIRIKQVRESKGISIEQLAKELEINESTINNWENGKLTTLRIPIFIKLINILGVSSDDILLK